MPEDNNTPNSRPAPIPFFDPSEALYSKKKHTIEFFHIPTGQTVTFKAWLTDFNDKYESEWGEEEVYGRMDPIQTFKGTKRSIDLAWDVVAASHEEAVSNMKMCMLLFQMLYPTYTGSGTGGVGTSMQAPPLFRLKFVNLVMDVTAGTKPGETSSAEVGGLVGTISGFSYSPDLDQGFFDEGVGTVYPQTLQLECTFTAMHTHRLGYGADGELRQKGFPYNVDGTAAGDSGTAADNTGGNSTTSGTTPTPSGDSTQSAEDRNDAARTSRMEGN